MSKNLKKENLIVIDLEFTCWMGRPPKGQRVEIIEIGIAEVDCILKKIIKTDSILIKPKSNISKFCTKITSITNDKVNKNGISLKEAFCFIETEYNIKSKPWCSWGKWDKVQIHRDCKRNNVYYPFSKKYVNLQNKFSKRIKEKRLYSVKNALEKIGLSFVGTQHNAKDDALNTARIFLKMFL